MTRTRRLLYIAAVIAVLWTSLVPAMAILIPLGPAPTQAQTSWETLTYTFDTLNSISPSTLEPLPAGTSHWSAGGNPLPSLRSTGGVYVPQWNNYEYYTAVFISFGQDVNIDEVTFDYARYTQTFSHMALYVNGFDSTGTMIYTLNTGVSDRAANTWYTHVRDTPEETPIRSLAVVVASVSSTLDDNQWWSALDNVSITYTTEDQDGDGIPDEEDACPTQGDQGNGVDASGCPIPGGSGCTDRRWDFETGPEGWAAIEDFAVTNGVYNEGVWYEDDPGALYTPGIDSESFEIMPLSAGYQFAETCSIVRISFRWQYEEYSVDQPFYVQVIDGGPGNYTLVAQAVFTGGTDEWAEFDWYPTQAQADQFTQGTAITIWSGTLSTDNVGVLVDWIEVDFADPPAWTLGRPLAEEDEIGLGQYGTPFAADYDYAVATFSQAWGDEVHAVADGEVVSVTSIPPYGDPCHTMFYDQNQFVGQGVQLVFAGVLGGVGASFTGGAGTGVAIGIGTWIIEQMVETPDGTPDDACLLSHAEMPLQEYSAFAGNIFVSYTQASTVIVDSPPYGQIRYLVDNPTVQPGDSVSEGCVIGTTTAFYFKTQAGIYNAFEMAQQGITFVAVYDDGDTAIPIVSGNFVTYPAAGMACAEGPVDSQCLNDNPAFDGSTGWTFSDPGTTELPGGGVRLIGQIQHSSPIQLDPETEYSVIVEAHLEAPDTQNNILQLALGHVTPPDAPIDIDVPADGSRVRFTVPPQVWTPSTEPDVYELWLQPDLWNTGTIILDFVCISDTLSDPVNLPSSCYFANPYFDSGADWTTSSGNLNGDPYWEPGVVSIPGSAWVQQSVTLPAGDWRIEYQGRLRPTTGDGTVDLEWTFGAESGGETFGTQEIAGYTADRCTGGTASASSYYSSDVASRAFDDSDATRWMSDPGMPDWVQYDFGSGVARTITRYSVLSYSDTACNAWTLSGSNDGTNFSTLDTRTGQSSWSASGETRTFDVSNSTAYRYYRLNCTATNGSSHLAIWEMQMMETESQTGVNTGTEWVTGYDTFTTAATTTQNFTFTAANPVHTDTNHLQLSSVCIRADDGSTPPGAPGGGQGPPQFADECQICSYTAIGDVASDLRELITWLACMIRQLWFCHAYTIAYGTWQGVLNILRGVGMLGRYLAYAAQRFVSFGGSFAYYLGGHLVNLGLRLTEAMGGTIVYVEGGGGGSGATLWDVLLALVNGLRDVLVTLLDDLLAAIDSLIAALAPVALGIVNALIAVINLAIGVFSLILQQLMLLPHMAAVAITAFNSAAAMPIPGAPDCSTFAAGGGNGLCMAIYVLDNTLMEGPAGALLPLLLGAASIWVLVWTINQIKGVFAGGG